MSTTETTPELEARIAVLEERLAEMEARTHEPGLEPLMRRLLPSETRGHLRAARREQLLAARSLLDRWIDRLEHEPPERLHRRESITLE